MLSICEERPAGLKDGGVLEHKHTREREHAPHHHIHAHGHIHTHTHTHTRARVCVSVCEDWACVTWATTFSSFARSRSSSAEFASYTHKALTMTSSVQNVTNWNTFT